MPKETFVRYHKSRIPIVVPDDAEVLRAPEVPALPYAEQAVADALASPIGSEPLAALLEAKNPRNVVITISDITRPVPNKLILPPILRTLHGAGIPEDRVTILVATGMHRPSTPEEKLELVGEEIASHYMIVDHRSEVMDELTELRQPSIYGTRVFINKRYMEADFRIVTGFIEPHFMAGFSGGRKGVCPGLANVATVQKFHGFQFLDSPNATNYVLDGNPLHEEATSVVEMTGIEFLVNVGLNEEKQIAGVFAGDWKQAFLAGTEKVKSWTSARATRTADLVVACAGGYPLDKTLYQTGKGMCSTLPILEQSGKALIVSACSEGLGSPSFTKIMREWGQDWRGFLEWIGSKETTDHDQWGFQMHAKLLQRTGVEGLMFACGGISPEDQARMSLTPIYFANGSDPNLEELRRSIQARIDGARGERISVIPDGPYTVPVLSA